MRAALVWGLVFFVALQLGLALLMDYVRPELRDPEYGYKLQRLRERLAAEHGRPLLLTLGSSRAALGVRPDVIPGSWPNGSRPPVVFNMALTGSGPVFELLTLRRLLAEGIHPDYLLVEVLTPLLHQDEGWGEVGWLNVNRLNYADYRVMYRYAEDTWFLSRRWVRSHLTPSFSHRFCIMSRYMPGWLPWNTRQDGWRGMDESGWLPHPCATVNAEEYRRGVAFAKEQYKPALMNYRISEKPDRATRELLEVCRQERIAVVLVLMPEGTEFRSWYSPASLGQIQAYLAGLTRSFDFVLVDTRTWLPDSAFVDGHHQLAWGAAAFTERLTREVLVPLMEKRVAAR
jgi:hypothetical protein